MLLLLLSAIAVADVDGEAPTPWVPGHVEMALGTGLNSPSAFLGLDARVRPIPELSFGVEIGVGPATTNPELVTLEVDEVHHRGWTPWRWSGSMMYHHRLSQREYRDTKSHRTIFSGWELTPRLAVMRNPGAQHYHGTCNAFAVLAGDDCSTATSTLTERPSAYFMSLTAGITYYSGWFFMRGEIGGTFRVSKHSTSPDNLPLDASKDPVGLALAFWMGAAFL
jgi:hypothetical protein